MASASAGGGLVEGQRLRREQAVVRRSECQDVESSSDAPEDPTHSELNVLLGRKSQQQFCPRRAIGRSQKYAYQEEGMDY